MNIEKPFVSIIIPVYNGSNYLGQAIDSALTQTYKNIEVIVVNDGSKDDGATEKIALSYGDKIRYVYKENGGVSSALNRGIKEMKGDYFSWLSHDDLYTETKIEKQVEKLKSGADIIICSERQVDKDLKFLNTQNDYSIFERQGVKSWQEELKIIISDRLFSGCALLIPKKVFESAGTFDEELRYSQDVDMWMRICLKGFTWSYNNDVGVLSRVHANQATQTRRDLLFTDSYKLGKRLIPELEKVSSKDWNFLYDYAIKSAKYNFKENVRECKKQAKIKKLFGFRKLLKINAVSFYGKIRPAIRRVYYRLIKKVKTQ